MSAVHSLTIRDASVHVGVSEKVIRAAIKSGDLIAHYPTARPVIRREELEEWLNRSPTEPPRS